MTTIRMDDTWSKLLLHVGDVLVILSKIGIQVKISCFICDHPCLRWFICSPNSSSHKGIRPFTLNKSLHDKYTWGRRRGWCHSLSKVPGTHKRYFISCGRRLWPFRLFDNSHQLINGVLVSQLADNVFLLEAFCSADNSFCVSVDPVRPVLVIKNNCVWDPHAKFGVLVGHFLAELRFLSKELVEIYKRLEVLKRRRNIEISELNFLNKFIVGFGFIESLFVHAFLVPDSSTDVNDIIYLGSFLSFNFLDGSSLASSSKYKYCCWCQLSRLTGLWPDMHSGLPYIF